MRRGCQYLHVGGRPALHESRPAVPYLREGGVVTPPGRSLDVSDVPTRRSGGAGMTERINHRERVRGIIALGLLYGYPRCCVAQFARLVRAGVGPARRQYELLGVGPGTLINDSPYVQCDRCLLAGSIGAWVRRRFEVVTVPV